MKTITTTQRTTDLAQFHTESNINNHGASMNNIEFSSLFQELTPEQAGAIQGGAAVTLAENSDGSFIVARTDEDVPNLGFFYNDRVSFIEVFSGEWEFWSDTNYQGSAIKLGPGRHDLTILNGGVYNDVISSFRASVR